MNTKNIIFKYYSHYSDYMNTTIQISKETKDLISTFGSKEDTYEDILKRMYKLAVKEQLREFLMSSENTITLEEACATQLPEQMPEMVVAPMPCFSLY